MSICIPVSIGEAFDKLAILKIKESQATEPEKLQCIRAEIAAISPHLQPYMQKCAQWFGAMQWVNRKLWDCVEVYHAESAKPLDQIDQLRYVKVCRAIQQHNAARFRTKAKLDSICASALREQKCHAKTGVLVSWKCPLAAIQYYSIYYDRVLVQCDSAADKLNLSVQYSDLAVEFVTDDQEIPHCIDLTPPAVPHDWQFEPSQSQHQ